jgi:hypothetical protein
MLLPAKGLELQQLGRFQDLLNLFLSKISQARQRLPFHVNRHSFIPSLLWYFPLNSIYYVKDQFNSANSLFQGKSWIIHQFGRKSLVAFHHEDFPLIFSAVYLHLPKFLNFFSVGPRAS